MRRIGFAVVLAIVVSFATGVVEAETPSDCNTARINQRGRARAALDNEAAACRGDRQCVKDAQATWDKAAKQIDDEASACRARARRATATEPPPYLHWKPGDPSPQAKDGRRYLMSCSGKVLGLYKPGGALEMELKTHPGNCIPRDDWGPGGFAPGTSDKHSCYETGTGSLKEYAGGKPSWCDPNR
jgi:hypothetical protein